MNYNGHATFQPIINVWCVCSDDNFKSSAILSLDVVYTGSSVIMMMLYKVNKQVQGNIRDFKFD